MNENYREDQLIEEDNTVYAIDPDCRVVDFSRKEESEGKRSRQMETWPTSCQEKSGAGRPGCGICPACLLCLLCLCKGSGSD